MEILICTASKTLGKKLLKLADEFLCVRKARHLSVSSTLYMTENAIINAVKKFNSAIIIFDVQAFKNWSEIAGKIEKLSRTVRICLVSGTAESAVEAINTLKTVCGYICKSMLEKMFEEIFSKIYGKLKTVCGGIAIMYYGGLNKVIPYDDIIFIETEKQTHKCTIVHKNGRDSIRADISKLINELPDVFRIVRSSGIANLSKVVSYADSELFFQNGSSCLCSRKYAGEIKSFLKQTVAEM
jgi:DNA-binding LytR/AlgR family response regulator